MENTRIMTKATTLEDPVETSSPEPDGQHKFGEHEEVLKAEVLLQSSSPYENAPNHEKSQIPMPSKQNNTDSGLCRSVSGVVTDDELSDRHPQKSKKNRKRPDRSSHCSVASDGSSWSGNESFYLDDAMAWNPVFDMWGWVLGSYDEDDIETDIETDVEADKRRAKDHPTGAQECDDASTDDDSLRGQQTGPVRTGWTGWTKPSPTAVRDASLPGYSLWQRNSPVPPAHPLSPSSAKASSKGTGYFGWAKTKAASNSSDSNPSAYRLWQQNPPELQVPTAGSVKPVEPVDSALRDNGNEKSNVATNGTSASGYKFWPVSNMQTPQENTSTNVAAATTQYNDDDDVDPIYEIFGKGSESTQGDDLPEALPPIMARRESTGFFRWRTKHSSDNTASAPTQDHANSTYADASAYNVLDSEPINKENNAPQQQRTPEGLAEPPPPPSDLPSGWKKAVRKSDGRVYYWEVATRRTSWIHPLHQKVQVVEATAPPPPPSQPPLTTPSTFTTPYTRGTVVGSTKSAFLQQQRQHREQQLHVQPRKQRATPYVGAGARPDNYKCFAILALLLFPPLGICAILYSCQVKPAWSRGRYGAAIRCSRKAYTFSQLSALIGISLWIYLVWSGKVELPGIEHFDFPDFDFSDWGGP